MDNIIITLCLMSVALSLQKHLCDTFKIAAYHDISVERQEENGLKIYPPDSLIEDSSDSNHIKDSHEKQSRGLIGSLFGGLGMGVGGLGVLGGGGGSEQGGGGNEQEVGTGEQGGGVLGGLIGGLLSPALSILGLSRNKMLDECGNHCEKVGEDHMAHVLRSCENNCGNEGMGETSGEESSEDQSSLVDVDADVLNGNQKPLSGPVKQSETILENQKTPDNGFPYSKHEQRESTQRSDCRDSSSTVTCTGDNRIEADNKHKENKEDVVNKEMDNTNSLQSQGHSREIKEILKTAINNKNDFNRDNTAIKKVRITSSNEEYEERHYNLGKPVMDKFNSIQTQDISSKDQTKKVGNIDRLQTEKSEHGEKKEMENKDSKKTAGIWSENIVHEDNKDGLVSEDVNTENLVNKGMDDKDILDTRKEDKKMGNMGNGGSLATEQSRSENVLNKEMGNTNSFNTDISDKNRGNKEMISAGNLETEKTSSKKVTNNEMNNIYNFEDSISGKKIINKEMDNVNSLIREYTTSIEQILDKEFDSKESSEMQDISSEKEAYKEMSNKDSLDANKVSSEELEYKEMDRSESLETDDIHNEKVVNKEMSDTYSLNKETNMAEKEMINTENLEKGDMRSYKMAEKDISILDSLEKKDISIKQILNKEFYSKDSDTQDISSEKESNKEMSNKDSLDAYNISENRKMDNTDSLEIDDIHKEKLDNLEMDDTVSIKTDTTKSDTQANKEMGHNDSSYSPSTLIEDTSNEGESSVKAHPGGYSYLEYDFDYENTEPTGSEEKKTSETSIGVDDSMESAKSTGKASRNYIHYPYSFKYNLPHVYRQDFNRIFRPLVLYHPRSLFLRNKLYGTSLKGSVPTAQFKQIRSPFLNGYPTSVAGSDLYGSYAYAHSGPFSNSPYVGTGIGEEPIVSEPIGEEPIINEPIGEEGIEDR